MPCVFGRAAILSKPLYLHAGSHENQLEQHAALDEKNCEAVIQFGWSPSFVHVCILSQSGYQGYSPVRDTWGVHIMRYVAFSHPRYNSRATIIIIIRFARISHLEPGLRSYSAKKSMKSSSSRVSRRSMNLASNSVGVHPSCTCPSSPSPGTMDLLPL